MHCRASVRARQVDRACAQAALASNRRVSISQPKKSVQEMHYGTNHIVPCMKARSQKARLKQQTRQHCSRPKSWVMHTLPPTEQNY